MEQDAVRRLAHSQAAAFAGRRRPGPAEPSSDRPHRVPRPAADDRRRRRPPAAAARRGKPVAAAAPADRDTRPAAARNAADTGAAAHIAADRPAAPGIAAPWLQLLRRIGIGRLRVGGRLRRIRIHRGWFLVGPRLGARDVHLRIFMRTAGLGRSGFRCAGIDLVGRNGPADAFHQPSQRIHRDFLRRCCGIRSRRLRIAGFRTRSLRLNGRQARERRAIECRRAAARTTGIAQAGGDAAQHAKGDAGDEPQHHARQA